MQPSGLSLYAISLGASSQVLWLDECALPAFHASPLLLQSQASLIHCVCNSTWCPSLIPGCRFYLPKLFASRKLSRTHTRYGHLLYKWIIVNKWMNAINKPTQWLALLTQSDTKPSHSSRISSSSKCQPGSHGESKGKRRQPRVSHP